LCGILRVKELRKHGRIRPTLRFPSLVHTLGRNLEGSETALKHLLLGYDPGFKPVRYFFV